MKFDSEQTKKWMEELNKKIQKQKEYLTDLDQAIGDGDHGLNMARGFQDVVTKIQSKDYQDMGAIFKEIGMTLLSKVGGASGPLYGTVFLKAANALQGKESVTLPEFANALSASLEGIKLRGKANVGDKTMVDVWEPVVAQMKAGVDWGAILAIARSSMEGTIHLEAKRGRAAYLGKRSIGHLDPGAVSSYYFFEKLAEVWEVKSQT